MYLDTQVKLAVIDQVWPRKVPEISQGKILLKLCYSPE